MLVQSAGLQVLWKTAFVQSRLTHLYLLCLLVLPVSIPELYSCHYFHGTTCLNLTEKIKIIRGSL
jgi:hypothetical protein